MKLRVLHCYRTEGNETVLSNIIEDVQGHYTHTALQVENIVLDSQKDGFNFLYYPTWKKHYAYTYSANTYDVSRVDFWNVASKYIGKKYGYFDLVRLFVFKKTGVWLGIKNETKRLVCSEAVALILNDLKITEIQRPWRTTPQDLHDLLN